MVMKATMPARSAGPPVPYGSPSAAGARFRRKFERFFPGGFQDQDYLVRERRRKWRAHEQWCARLAPETCRSMLREGRHVELALRAVEIGVRSGLLSPMESGALLEAVRPPRAAERFAVELCAMVQAPPGEPDFERWCGALESFSWRRTSALTWPVATLFGFIARPDRHIMLKPVVTRLAAREYGFDFRYHSRPNSRTYSSLQRFAAGLLLEVRDLHPSDLIDIQSFIWVQGAGEYEE